MNFIKSLIFFLEIDPIYVTLAITAAHFSYKPSSLVKFPSASNTNGSGNVVGI